MKKSKTIVLISTCLFLILSSCYESKQFKNVENMKKLDLGDNKETVILKMESEPDKIVENDSVFTNQEMERYLLTYIYYAPTGSSSNIHLYFKNDTLFKIHKD